MPSHAFRVHGAGCGLADWIHGPVDFASPRFDPYRSRAPGDGGLAMGKVTFREDLLQLAARRRADGEPAQSSWEGILADILGPDASLPGFNVGGPALASLTLAAQLLRPSRVPVTYYGVSGDDAEAARIRHTLAQTPLDITCFRRKPGRTTASQVFSDPRAGGGAGDRFFVHCQGADLPVDDLHNGESFFQAVFNVYAGTAQMPSLHRALPALLAKSRRRGALTVVGAVYDHEAEKSAPGRRWPMGGPIGDEGGGEGNGREAWPFVDLLIADAAEIRGLAGLPGVPPLASAEAGASLESAAAIETGVQALFDLGLGAAVVTQGAGPVYYRSLGGPFGECRGWAEPHAELIAAARDPRNPGDTSGAGDNFLGALIADLMQQLLADDFYPKGEPHVDRELLSISPLRLRHAIDFACVAGGLACQQRGGVRLEAGAGENLGRIRAYLPKPAVAGRPW